MIEQLDQDVVRVPGQSVEVNVRFAERSGVATGATIVASFDSVKGLLSERPLQRPNRTRPLSEDELELAELEHRLDAGSSTALQKGEANATRLIGRPRL